MAAVTSRVYFMICDGLRSTVRFDEHLGVGLVDRAVTPVARLKIDDRLKQVAAPEIGPQYLGHVNLRVGNLPEQKVRDAKLAAGANQQIGMIDIRRVQVIA